MLESFFKNANPFRWWPKPSKRFSHYRRRRCVANSKPPREQMIHRQDITSQRFRGIVFWLLATHLSRLCFRSLEDLPSMPYSLVMLAEGSPRLLSTTPRVWPRSFVLLLRIPRESIQLRDLTVTGSFCIPSRRMEKMKPR